MTKEDLLFHYTDVEGLLGILRTQVLWATDMRYLNDGTELLYGGSLLRDAADEVGGRPHRESGLFDALKPYNIHVACFCSDGDLLSQWRGYGKFGAGYAIGFRREKLALACEQSRKGAAGSPARLLRVEYEMSTLKASALEIMREAFGKKSPDDADSARVTDFMASAKRREFAQECEWRIVHWPDDNALRFRDIRGILAPYSEFALCPKSDATLDTSVIAEVRVGPGRANQLGLDSVQRLLRTLGLVGVAVEPSSIPFR